MALKMVKVAESMARTMRLQLKFTKRSRSLAIRTLVLTFCLTVSIIVDYGYHILILDLLLALFR